MTINPKAEPQPVAPAFVGQGVRGVGHPWAGWGLALSASLAFSFAAPIARGTIQAGLDPTALVTVRLTLATLLMGLTTLFMNRGQFRMDRRGLAIALLAGVLNGSGMLLMFWALVRVDASMASMLISLMPLVVLTMLALRGERFTYRHTVRLALGLGGIYLLIGPGGTVDATGIGLLMTAVLCFATHMTMLQWYLRPYDSRAVTLYISAAMAATVAAVWLWEGAPWTDPGPSGWTMILILVVVSTYLSRLLMVAAINRIGSGQMALLTPLETLLTLIWSMIFLGERLTPIQLMGGGLILSSALLAIQRLGRAKWPPRWRLWARA
jgi:drug/metabolite transporter (DMT)-like permease